MQVRDLTSVIENYAPLSLQESYDNAGLICGSLDNEVSSVLLCTDVTEAVIDEAIAGNFNLIISHHPLSIQPLKNLLPDNWIKRCLIRAIKNDLNIYAAHTNMDAVLKGVSGKIADKLELTEREILKKEGKLYSLTFYTPLREAEKVRQAVLDTGAGHIGNYSHCSFNSTGTGTFLSGKDAHPFCGEPGSLHHEEEIKTEITVPDYLLASAVKRLKEVHPYEDHFPLRDDSPHCPLQTPSETNRRLRRFRSFSYPAGHKCRSRLVYHWRCQIPRLFQHRKPPYSGRHRAL